MQLDWRECKCRGRFDVPLGARDRIVDAVTPAGIVTDASDNIDWGKVSKWRDAHPVPPIPPHVMGIPAGFALVPIEPTQDMVDAAEATTTLANNFCEADLIDIYKAMILEAIKETTDV